MITSDLIIRKEEKQTDVDMRTLDFKKLDKCV